MFVVVYAFTAKPGQDADFCRAWGDLTACIYQERGSLGSRLHRSGPSTYIAYAQWPSREVFAASRAQAEGSEAMQAASAAMRAARSKSEVLYEMDMLDDRLARVVADGSAKTE